MEFYHDLENVVPPITGWHIRVKVLRLFRVWFNPHRKRLGLVLANEDGVRIEAFVDHTMTDYYDGFLEEGKWYTITKFELFNNLARYRATAHHFKVNFLEDTLVKPLRPFNGDIVNRFADFRYITDGSIDDTYLVDLVGAIFDIGPLDNTAHNGVDIDGFKIPFKIMDKNEHVLSCMAVKQEASDFDRNYQLHGRGTIIVVLRWWKVYRYWDGPNNVKICTHGPISKAGNEGQCQLGPRLTSFKAYISCCFWMSKN